VTTPASASPIEQLNRDCFCLSLDRNALAHALDAELGQPGLSALMRERCPSVFAAQPVFVAAPQLQRIAQVVRAVESVVALPAYREQALASAPAIARLSAGGALGVFFGYDFHLDGGRLGLIEINTNAGGAMLNAVLARAQRSCCAAMDEMVPTSAGVAAFEQRLVDMFRHEWRLAGHSRPLLSIAIVDDAPEQQYLYPEFLLFQRLFERHGLRAVIADPAALVWRDGALWHGELALDLVYNRLTDFYLEQAASAALRQAYVQQRVVLTPHPQAHALYADKRQLAIFAPMPPAARFSGWRRARCPGQRDLPVWSAPMCRAASTGPRRRRMPAGRPQLSASACTPCSSSRRRLPIERQPLSPTTRSFHGHQGTRHRLCQLQDHHRTDRTSGAGQGRGRHAEQGRRAARHHGLRSDEHARCGDQRQGGARRRHPQPRQDRKMAGRLRSTR
jgi:hypothetical protein